MRVPISRLKKRILVQNRDGAEFYTAGIRLYFEGLKRGTNKEFGPKEFFEIASNKSPGRLAPRTGNAQLAACPDAAIRFRQIKTCHRLN